MSELDDDDREILVLKHIEGYSYDELAAALGIGSGTVASRLYRARGRLREALERLDPALIGDPAASKNSVGEEQ
jgi:RNA polymerase sigma-70 factor (ECF subfamily)